MDLNKSAKQELAARLGSIGQVKVDEPMSRHTSYHVGGPADLYLMVDSREGLVEAVSLATELGVPTLVIGGGSNLLVSDRGIRGLVIENRSRRWDHLGERQPPPWWDVDLGCVPHAVRMEGGMSLPRIARLTADLGLAGLEWAAGIPGTVGGAIVNNAGAHGSNVAAILESVLMLEDGQIKTVSGSALGFAYRQSILKGMRTTKKVKPVILEGTFLLRKEPVEQIKRRMEGYQERRRNTQPKLPSAGSVFKNPPGYIGAWWLIEQCGLKGERRGDAQISEVHANFIVNCGHAKAEDVRGLMDLARARVFEEFGVSLELEQEIVGDW